MSFTAIVALIATSLESDTSSVPNESIRSLPSRNEAFVHYDSRNFQTEPFRQFFDTYGEPLKLKPRDLYD